jgi:hypothetical protein
VAEIGGYQKIIDGARQVVEFNNVCSLEYGESLPEKDRIAGEYRVLGSNGITDGIMNF